MTEGLLRTAELATELRVTPRTIYEWSRTGRIPMIRVGRGNRYSLPAVMEALSAESKPAVAVPQRRRRKGDRRG